MGSPYTFNAELLNPALNPNVRIANSMADGSEVVSVSPKGTWIATVDNRQVINLSGFDQIGVAVWPTDRNSASIMRAFGCEVKIGR